MTREEQEKREENGRRTEKEQKGEQSEQEEKLASRLEKGKSHFKVKRLVSWHNFLIFLLLKISGSIQLKGSWP